MSRKSSNLACDINILLEVLQKRKYTFLNMFTPISAERSGTAGLLRLVNDTLEKVSELKDLLSSLHFRVISFEKWQRKKQGIRGMHFLKTYDL